MSETILAAIISFFGTVIAAIITASAKADFDQDAARPNRSWLRLKIALRDAFRPRRVLWFLGIWAAAGVVLFFTLQAVNAQKAIPFVVLHRFNFEKAGEQAGVSAWISVPKEKNFPVERYNGIGHNSRSSLRLLADWQSFLVDEKEYGGVGITVETFFELNTSTILAGEAWVYVPANNQTVGNKFTAHMFSYTQNKNEDYLATYGSNKILEPGKWTRLVWAPAYSTELKINTPAIHEGFTSSNWISEQIYITIISEKPYQGEVFFDDIVFYGERP